MEELKKILNIKYWGRSDKIQSIVYEISDNYYYKISYGYTGNKYSELWYPGYYKYHRLDGPAKIFYDEHGNIYLKKWYQNGKLHRPDGPAKIENYNNGKIESEFWYQNGKLHRSDGPAYIRNYDNGKIESECWYIYDKVHRTNGPVIIKYDDDNKIHSECWCYEGKRHRTDGPAMISYKKGKIYICRYYVDNILYTYSEFNKIAKFYDIYNYKIVDLVNHEIILKDKDITLIEFINKININILEVINDKSNNLQ